MTAEESWDILDITLKSLDQEDVDRKIKELFLKFTEQVNIKSLVIDSVCPYKDELARSFYEGYIVGYAMSLEVPCSSIGTFWIETCIKASEYLETADLGTGFKGLDYSEISEVSIQENLTDNLFNLFKDYTTADNGPTEAMRLVIYEFLEGKIGSKRTEELYSDNKHNDIQFFDDLMEITELEGLKMFRIEMNSNILELIEDWLSEIIS